jgi:hypothetical protein
MKKIHIIVQPALFGIEREGEGERAASMNNEYSLLRRLQ